MVPDRASVGIGATLSLGLAVLLAPRFAMAGALDPTGSEASALRELGSRLPGGRLLWVRGGKIYYSSIADFEPKRVTPDGLEQTNPRWSPDGRRVLYVASDGVYIMDASFADNKKVIAGGNTASWTRDGQSITAVASDGHRVVQYDLANGATKTIYDARQAPYNGQKVSQAAELRVGGRYLLTFRLTPEHTTEIVDLQQKQYISNSEMMRGDCSPAWAPNGSYILNTARTSSRPVLKASFDASSASIGASQHFVGLVTSAKFYIHGQRVSNDGKWVAFGGKIFDDSAHDPRAEGKREIYVWRIGEAESQAVRVTFDTNEDESPSLFIASAEAKPRVSLDPKQLSFSAEQGAQNPAAQEVSLNNSGGGVFGSVDKTVTYGPTGKDWLDVSVTGSDNRYTLHNAVDVSRLSPNNYTATVAVTAGGADNGAQSYTVSLRLQEDPDGSPPTTTPKLALDRSLLTFSTMQGVQVEAEQVVHITNEGNGELQQVESEITYANGEGWLDVVVPQDGGNERSIANRITVDGLSPNTYTATVSILEPSASNSPQAYTVSLEVQARPDDPTKPPADEDPPTDAGLCVSCDGAKGDAGQPEQSGHANALADSEGTLGGGCTSAGTYQGAEPALFPVLLLVLVLVLRLRCSPSAGAADPSPPADASCCGGCSLRYKVTPLPPRRDCLASRGSGDLDRGF